MTNPTNRDLEIRMIRMEGTINNVLEKMVDFKVIQEKHERKDEEQFSQLNTSVNNMHKYAISIAGVAAFIGAAITSGTQPIIDWLKK